MNTIINNIKNSTGRVKTERTVYERILDRNNSGLEESLEENQFQVYGKTVNLVDGIMDRMPFMENRISGRQLEGLEKTLKTAAAGETKRALRNLKKTPVHNGARWIDICDGIELFIESNTKDLSTEGMRTFIHSLLLKSAVLEEVKMALYLYKNLLEHDPSTDEIVLNYARTAEFSQLAMPLVKRMKNGNQLLFEIAKDSTRGAKVTATELLDPETKEIEDWLFREGTDPFLSYYYSSVPISKKCNLVERMKDPELTDEDYYTICRVVYPVIFNLTIQVNT